MRAVAREIVFELDNNNRQQQPQLVTADPPGRDSLLRRIPLREENRLNAATSRRSPSARRRLPSPSTTSRGSRGRARQQQPQHLQRQQSFTASEAISRPLPQEEERIRSTESRVRPDFSFPSVEADGPSSNNNNFPLKRSSATFSSSSSSSVSERELLHRLGGRRPRFGVSSHSCLFKLCELGDSSSGHSQQQDTSYV